MMGCHSAGIEVLQTSIIQYAELPKEVKKVMFLKNYTEQDGSISQKAFTELNEDSKYCLLYTSPSPRDQRGSRMPSSA